MPNDEIQYPRRELSGEEFAWNVKYLLQTDPFHDIYDLQPVITPEGLPSGAQVIFYQNYAETSTLSGLRQIVPEFTAERASDGWWLQRMAGEFQPKQESFALVYFPHAKQPGGEAALYDITPNSSVTPPAQYINKIVPYKTIANTILRTIKFPRTAIPNTFVDPLVANELQQEQVTWSPALRASIDLEGPATRILGVSAIHMAKDGLSNYSIRLAGNIQRQFDLPRDDLFFYLDNYGTVRKLTTDSLPDHVAANESSGFFNVFLADTSLADSSDSSTKFRRGRLIEEIKKLNPDNNREPLAAYNTARARLGRTILANDRREGTIAAVSQRDIAGEKHTARFVSKYLESHFAQHILELVFEEQFTGGTAARAAFVALREAMRQSATEAFTFTGKKQVEPLAEGKTAVLSRLELLYKANKAQATALGITDTDSYDDMVRALGVAA